MLKTGRDVRPHHYQFAHHALPQVMFGSMDENLANLVDRPQEFVDLLWGFVGKKVAQRGLQALPAPGPVVHRLALDPGAMWVVQLPPPEAMAEALFVGLVPMRPQGTPDERLACFTLEYSFDPQTQEQYYVLCSWTADGRHRNHALKVQPTVAAFSQAVLAVLRPATQQ